MILTLILIAALISVGFAFWIGAGILLALVLGASIKLRNNNRNNN